MSHQPNSAPSSLQLRADAYSEAKRSIMTADIQPRPTGSNLKRLSKIYAGTGYEVKGLFTGPVDVQDFLDSFFRSKSPRPQAPRLFDGLHSTSRMATHTAWAKATSALVPSLFVRNTLDRPDPVCGLAPGISFYQKGSDVANGTDFVTMTMFADIKPRASDDPFNDKKSQVSPTFETEDGFLFRGQMASSAAAVIGMQYRTHAFSFAIFGPYARLFRWDPSGVVVTERFDYTTTDHLAEFLWRFNDASDPFRGLDATVSRVAELWPLSLAPSEALERLRDEKEFMDDKFDGTPFGLPGPSTPRHRYFSLIKVPHRSDPTQTSEILVSCPPRYRLRPPVGRDTRPSLAYDLALKRIVFFKQYWRSIGEGSVKEGDVYFTLDSNGVQNIPKFGHGNDVGRVVSLTHRFQHWQMARGFHAQPLPRYKLYRMTLLTVCEPITQFQSTKELLMVVMDAMTAHDEAVFKAKILHGDISVGNIMIEIGTRRGVLVDWDLAFQDVDVLNWKTSNRRGTWEFMSINLVKSPQTVHSIVDDRESAVYLLVWLLLQYSPHNKVNALPNLLNMFYYDGPMDKCPREATYKLCFLAAPSKTFDETATFQDGAQSIAHLITFFQDVFFRRYHKKSGKGNEAYQDLSACPYIDQEGWFVGILEEALTLGTWPSSDGAIFYEKWTRPSIGPSNSRSRQEEPQPGAPDGVRPIGSLPNDLSLVHLPFDFKGDVYLLRVMWADGMDVDDEDPYEW